MEDIDWKQYFNEKAKVYNGSEKTSDYFNEKSFYTQRDSILKWLGELKGKEILDAGCGVGAFSEPLTHGNKVYGVDFSDESLEYAKKRGLNTYCGDVTKLPYEDGKFDIVLCIGVIQLVKEYEKLVDELARVTKKGGVLLIETLNKNSVQRKIYNMIDRTKRFDLMYAADELKQMYIKKGFNDIEFMTLFLPFSHVTYGYEIGFLEKYFGTSFAIKGRKIG